MSRRLAGVALAAVTMLLAAACGSDPAPAGDSAPKKLSIGIPGPSTASAVFIMAAQKGLFVKYGVEVEIIDKASLVGTEVAAGNIDLAQFGTSGAFAPAEAGRPTSIIYGLSGNVAAGVQVGANSAMTKKGSLEETLMQLSGKRIAIQGVGGSSWGNLKAISKYVEDRGGKPLVPVSLPTNAAKLAQLVSGQVDASIGFPNPLVSALNENKVRILVDADDPGIATITGGSFPGVAVFGLKKNLGEKRAAVEAFVAAIRDAFDVLANQPVEQSANDLHAHKIYADFAVADLTQQLGYDKPFWQPDGGKITQETWATTLKALALWGLPQNVADAKFGYGEVVDMSYYDATNKIRK